MTTQDLVILNVLAVVVLLAVLVPLVWAAIQDGRYNDQWQRVYREQGEVMRARPSAIEISRAK